MTHGGGDDYNFKQNRERERLIFHTKCGLMKNSLLNCCQFMH